MAVSVEGMRCHVKPANFSPCYWPVSYSQPLLCARFTRHGPTMSTPPIARAMPILRRMISSTFPVWVWPRYCRPSSCLPRYSSTCYTPHCWGCIPLYWFCHRSFPLVLPHAKRLSPRVSGAPEREGIGRESLRAAVIHVPSPGVSEITTARYMRPGKPASVLELGQDPLELMEE